MEKRIRDNFGIKGFDVAGNSIHAWLASARNLLCASKIIEDYSTKDESCDINVSFNVFGVDLMLRAYSLECFFKAIWLSKGNKLFENGKINAELCKHDLYLLSQKVGIDNFDKSEKELLKKLHQFSIVYGRYPITKSYENYFGCDFPVHHIEISYNIIKKLLKHFPLKQEYQSILDYISGMIL